MFKRQSLEHDLLLEHCINSRPKTITYLQVNDNDNNTAHVFSHVDRLN